MEYFDSIYTDKVFTTLVLDAAILRINYARMQETIGLLEIGPMSVLKVSSFDARRHTPYRT